MALAAVEMLTLGHCRKMMVFNTDLGLDSDTDIEPVNGNNDAEGKRLLSEAEDDHDRGHVKKRRKQSKPVRIASSESLSDAENYTENESVGNKTPNTLVEDNVTFSKSSHDNVNLTNSNDEEYKTKTDVGIRETYDHQENYSDSSLLPINLSNVKCLTNDTIAEYGTDTTHNINQNLDKDRRSEVGGTSFQDTFFESPHFERESYAAASSVHGLHASNNVRHSGSPVRIFNPEAFCDLCNKEFCNKYFLKTHKANKHGIYSDNVGPNLIDTLPSLPFINYFSNVNESLSSNSQVSRSVPRKPHLPAPLPQQNSPFLQKPLIANGNTRAFCNICQREFCNKYFVRRHKAKIHGLIDTSYPDTPPSEMNDQKMYAGNDEKSQDHEMHSTLSDRQTWTGVLISPLDGEKLEQRAGETRNFSVTDRSNEIRPNNESDFGGRVSPGMMTTLSPTQTLQMTSVQQTEETNKENDSADKTKRIINIEAFCDICCKEYCNKYFLRTHKMRSHGITQADWERRELSENGSPHSSAVPLNLIVGDQSICDSDNAHLDIFCNVCGQKFKDIFLLKLHASYAHPHDASDKTTANDIGNVCNEELPKAKSPFKSESNTTSNEKCYGADIQTVSVLYCEICHKGFDASSLEAHIETEHGNLLEEVGTLVEDNSDSQLFQKELKYDCALCRKTFTSTNRLNQHIIECHGSTGEQISINNMINAKTIKDVDESPKSNHLHGLFGAVDVQTAPTSSFCEICKKELCNKYFMKTHMQRMHGISIDNGAHIGGVVCDICNKELCSKYFLRVHKQNSHGIVDEILGLDVSRNHSPGTDSSLRPSEQGDLSNRYFSHFTEVCTVCSRRFRSMKWLKAHLLNDHGEEGKDKWRELQSYYESRQPERYNIESLKKSEAVPQAGCTDANVVAIRNYGEGFSQKIDSSSSQSDGNHDTFKNSVFTNIFNGKTTSAKQYHCSYCPFSTSILAFLFVHERSHINNSNSFMDQNKKYRCKVCSSTFENDESYEKHCVSHTLSETSGSTSNGFATKQIEKLNKVVLKEPTKWCDGGETEVGVKEDSCEFSKSSSCQFKASVKISKGNETRTEGDVRIRKYDTQVHNGPKHDFVPTFDVSFSEEPRREYIPDEKPKRSSVTDDRINAALTQVKESLQLIADRTDIPVSFSLPQNQKQVIMQPFVLEDPGQQGLADVSKSGLNKSFLSSIVFLPVKERLTNPVTVSFRLTPTL